MKSQGPASPGAATAPSGAGARDDPGQGRPGFTLDLARCVGCGACALGCRMENGLSAGVAWRRILQVNRARVGSGPTFHLSVSCHHCENPPCVGACPSGALAKNEDQLVLLNTDRCIGCRYCEMACPFGAPSFDAEAGVMTKCHLCHHRLAQGAQPACVEACPTQALGFSYPKGGITPSAPGPSGDKVLVPAVEIPGFGDPTEAEPGFWVAPPGGAVREEWYKSLKALLGYAEEEGEG